MDQTNSSFSLVNSSHGEEFSKILDLTGSSYCLLKYFGNNTGTTRYEETQISRGKCFSDFSLYGCLYHISTKGSFPNAVSNIKQI